uniref:Uncharacterized protein n=1 Tax=Manihot esculenta TaxID=3983 RepID=A0A2C9U8E3_MANES
MFKIANQREKDLSLDFNSSRRVSLTSIQFHMQTI